MKKEFDSIKLMCVKNDMDNRRLLCSQVFKGALEYSICSYLMSNNTSCFLTIVNVFTEKNCRLFVADFLYKKMNLKFTIKGEKLRLNKTVKIFKSEIDFQSMLDNFIIGGFKMKGRHSCIIAEKKKRPKKIDMLDSRARLSGCYGAGKRR